MQRHLKLKSTKARFCLPVSGIPSLLSRILFLAFCLLGGSGTHALEPKLVIETCETMLLRIQAEMGGSVGSGNFFDKESIARGRTVHVLRTVPGHFGGNRLVLKKIGVDWISNFETIGYDHQGDPRWLIEALGAQAAAYFGFVKMDENHMMVPDGAEFQGAIAAVNARLVELGKPPIPIKFYITETNDNVKVKFYVTQFADHAAIPIAPSGNHLIHDLSFHTGAIFLPPPLVALKQQTAKFLNAFLESEERKYQTDEWQHRALRYYSYLLRMHETQFIDMATGLVTVGLAEFLRKHETNSAGPDHANPNISSLYYLTNLGLGEPREYFLALLHDMIPSSDSAVFKSRYGAKSQLQRVESFMPDLDLNGIIEDLKAFHYEGIDASQWQPYQTKTQFEPFEPDCLWMTQRRIEIRDIAIELSQTQIHFKSSLQR